MLELLTRIKSAGITLPLEDGALCVHLLKRLVTQAPVGTYARVNEPYTALLAGHAQGLDPSRGGIGAYLPLQPLAQKTLQGSIPAQDYFDLYLLALGINFARGLGGTAQLVGSEQVYRHVSLAGEEGHGPIAQCALALTSPIRSWDGVWPYWWEIFEAGGLFLGAAGQLWKIDGDRLTILTDNLSHWGATLRHRQQNHFGLPEVEQFDLKIVGAADETAAMTAQWHGKQIVSLMTDPVVSEHYTDPQDMWLHAEHDQVYHGSTKARLGISRLREVFLLGNTVAKQPGIANNLWLKTVTNIREAAHMYDNVRGRPVVYVVNSAIMGMELLYLISYLSSDEDQYRNGRRGLLMAATAMINFDEIPIETLKEVSAIARGERGLSTSYQTIAEPLQFFPALQAAGLPVEITWG